MTKAYVGSTEASKAYLGSDLVYTKEVLPYDAEIKYLRSTGTQYINLPMNVPSGTYFEMDMYFVPVYVNTKKHYIFSANPYQQFYSNFYSRNSSTNVIMYTSVIGTIATSGGWTAVNGTEAHCILSTSGKTNYDGTYTELPRPLTANIKGFRLFASYQSNYRYPIAFHKVKFTAGTTVLYDLVSVRKDGVGYMYDKISGTFFGNNGTGSFTLGADV